MKLTFFFSQETYDISVASDLSEVKISDKIHYLILSITSSLDVVKKEDSLPDKLIWSSTGTITNYLNEFTRLLEQVEEFYSNINTIDELCFVVDPIQPSTKINYRIFKIGKSYFALYYK